MTVKVITTIRCDKCGKDGPKQKSGKVAMINWVRMVAREYGWVKKIKYGKIKDICPDCIASAL